MLANRHVSIDKCHAPEVSIGAFVFVYYKCLKVNFYFVIIDNKMAEELLSRCLAQSLDILELHFKHISVNGLRSIASHCGPSLRILKTEVDDKKSLAALQSVCKSCANLIILDLEGFYPEKFSEDLVLTAVQYCPLIQRLPTLHLDLSDLAMSVLASLYTLTELKLRRYSNSSSEAIQRILQSNPSISCISLEGDYIEDALITCIGRSCSNLKRLRFIQDTYIYNTAGVDNIFANTLSDSALFELFSSCTHLEEFTLHQASVFTVASLRAMFLYCEKLTTLELRINSPTPASSEPFLEGPYPSLTKVTLEFDGVAAQDLFTYCINMREVKLRHMLQLTDEAIKPFLYNCINLDTFTLDSCGDMTIDGMNYIASHCPHLRVLTLAVMPINENVLIQLSLYCPKLTSLSIHSCHQEGPFTEAGVLALVERCTNLTALTIGGPSLRPFTRTLELMKQGQLYTHIKFNI